MNTNKNIRYYLAYGSNMPSCEMRSRCPNAKLVGKTYIEDWKLRFNTHADIVPCKGSRVPAVVWQIDSVDERILDRYESYPNYYEKITISVEVAGSVISAMAYVMTERNKSENVSPSKHYLDTIRKGYIEHGFAENLDLRAVEKMIYVAYGSNMSRSRMLKRCPNAKFLTAGVVEHHTLQFHHYADAAPAHDYEMPVVLWEIPANEFSILERAEGYPRDYIKQRLAVVPKPEKTHEEMVELVGEENVTKPDYRYNGGIVGTAFVMTEWKRTEWKMHSEQTPSEYAQYIIDGYRENNITGQCLQDLQYALERGESNPESRS